MRDEAVSEVVGEMLMISLVLLLVAVFAASLGNCLPTERSPTVTIMMTSTADTITLYHKGGDWVKATDLEVLVSNATMVRTYSCRSVGFTLNPPKMAFDLGSSISIDYAIAGDEQVRLTTPRAVLFCGEVR